MLPKFIIGAGSVLGATLLLVAAAAHLRGEDRAKPATSIVLTVYSDYV
ncbi:MAG: hypothetical protein U0527_09880 [Candidatus Eisenbacteria bacterium]